MQLAVTRRQLLGRLLQYRRKSQGVTQSLLAAAMGKSQSTLSKIERGQVAVDYVALIYAARCLGWNHAELFSHVDRFARLTLRRNIAVRDERLQRGDVQAPASALPLKCRCKRCQRKAV